MRAVLKFVKASTLITLLSVGILQGAALAKAPGCYEASGTSYKSVTCTDSLKAEANSACFVRASSTASFESVSCSSLDSTTSSTGGSSSTSGASLTGDLSAGGGKVEGFLQDAVNLLTVVAGLAIAASVIFAGIRYSSSGGNPQAAAEAKKRITNAVIATVCWVLLYTFLNWLIPGGAIN